MPIIFNPQRLIFLFLGSEFFSLQQNPQKMLNFNSPPTVHLKDVSGFGPRKSLPTPQKMLDAFFESGNFQNFCDHSANGVFSGCILFVAKAKGGNFIKTTAGELYVEFNFTIGEKISPFVKTPKYIGFYPPEFRTTFTQSYILYKDQEGWCVEEILADEAWLRCSNVQAAFERVALFQRLKILGSPKMMALEELDPQTKQAPHAWVAPVTDAQGEAKLLLCSVDSGQITLASPAGYLVPTNGLAMVKTNLNWFKCLGRGLLMRNK